MGLFGNDSDHEDDDSRVKRKKLTVIKFDAQELLAAGWTAEQVKGLAPGRRALDWLLHRQQSMGALYDRLARGCVWGMAQRLMDNSHALLF
jgi:hypothetical protein